MTDAVDELFVTAIAEGPTAATRDERQALLRGANEAIAEQVRGYYRRPWADGDPESVIRSFLCECGESSCTAFVEVSVKRAAEPVYAPEHE